MVPKLKAFYFTYLLPELAVPRHGTVSGIRKPQLPWYTPQTPSAVSKGKQCSRQRSTQDSQKSISPSQTSASLSASSCQTVEHTSTKSPVSQDTNLRRLGRERKVNFVGRRIRHKWEADGTEKWYTGVVTGVSSGTDGDSGAVYYIQYDDDNEVYDVDDLITDYNEGNLQFADL